MKWQLPHQVILLFALLSVVADSYAQVSLTALSDTKNSKEHKTIQSNTEKFFRNLSVYDSLVQREKVFLRFDADSQFGPGEEVTFQAFVFLNSTTQLSSMSKVLYVELINPSCQLIDYRKIQIVDGKGSGSINFPNSIYSGLYEVRAYTSWMQNFDASGFFSQTKFIGKRFDKEATHVHFYPAYGKLWAKTSNTLGVRTTDKSGLPAAGFIRIFDDKDHLISQFHTDSLGMGKILNFTPSIKKKYYAVINNSKQRWELPKIFEKAPYELSISENRNVIITRIVNRDTDEMPVYISAESSGKIGYFQAFSIKPKTRFEFEIEKTRLVYGHNQISILDKDLNEIASKAFFLLEKEPDVVESRGFFSESRDDYLYGRSNASDFTTISLNDLPDKTKIDLYSMVHSWDKVNHKEILDSSFHDFIYPIEKGFTINGKVVLESKSKDDLTGVVNMIVKSGNPKFLTTEVNREGLFKIQNVHYNDTTDLMFNYVGSTDEPYEIEFDTIDYSFTPGQSAVCTKERQDFSERHDKYILQIKDAKLLDEVQVTTTRRNTYERPKRSNLLYSNPTWSITLEDDDSKQTDVLIAGGILEYLTGRVPGSRTLRNPSTGEITSFTLRGIISIGTSSSALFIYEGMSMSAADFNRLDPYAIGKIDVLSGANAAIYGARGAGGVIVAYAPIYSYDAEINPAIRTYNLPGGYSISAFDD